MKLSYIDNQEMKILPTIDASYTAVGAVIKQEINFQLKPIAFFSITNKIRIQHFL